MCNDTDIYMKYNIDYYIDNFKIENENISEFQIIIMELHGQSKKFREICTKYGYSI